MKKFILSLSVIFLFLSFAACSQNKKDKSKNIKAICKLNPTFENSAKGTVHFIQLDDNKVKVVFDLSEVSPGKHGIHVHEFGDCSAPDAKSAGDHYNPEKMNHASPNDSHRHMGDLGNVIADENGIVKFDYIDTKLKLDGEYSIIGKSVILHADEDDLKSQPTGNSGARIACGIIEIK